MNSRLPSKHHNFTTSFPTHYQKQITIPDISASFFSCTRGVGKICRICKEEKEGWIFGNFISPCECSSEPFVHEECLKKWIVNKNSSLANCRCINCGFKYRMLYKCKKTISLGLIKKLPRYLLLLFLTLDIFWLTSFIWLLLLTINLISSDFLFTPTSSNEMIGVKVFVDVLLFLLLCLCSYTIHTFLKEKCSKIEVSEWEIYDCKGKGKKEVLFGRRNFPKSQSLVLMQRVQRLSQTNPIRRSQYSRNSHISLDSDGNIISYNSNHAKTSNAYERPIPILSNFKSLAMSQQVSRNYNSKPSLSSFKIGNVTVNNSPSNNYKNQVSMEVSFHMGDEEEKTQKRESDEKIAADQEKRRNSNIFPNLLSSLEVSPKDSELRDKVIRMTIHLDKL